MKNDILIPLLNNAVLLLALAMIYDLLTAKGPRRKQSISGTLASGIALGFLGIGLMLACVRLTPGIVFDTRSVLLSLSGLFFGPVPTIIAMAMTAAFRLSQGGAAAYAGTAVIIATGSIGLIWQRLRKKPLGHISAGELYVFGIVNHIVMLALMLMLPLETARHVLSQISGPVLLIYPLATVALGLLLAGQLRRQQTSEALAESETTYRKLFQNNHVVMLLIDPETGAIVDANPAASHFYGWTGEELRRMKIYQIGALPPGKMQTEFEKAKAGRKNSFNFQHRLADGSIRDVEVLSGPVRMGEQKLLYSIVYDVTERKQLLTEAEQARHAALSILEDAVLAKHRLEITQHALDRSADAVLWVERDAAFSYANESACRLLGYTRSELLKLSVPEIDRNYPVEKMAEVFTTLTQQKTLDVESVLTSKDGRIIPVEIHNSLIEFESRTFICAFIHDISERKRMQAAIEKRIVTLTRPLDQDPTIVFDELFDLDEFQRIQDEFSAATGVASIITLPDGTPITRASNFTRLCNDIIRKTEKGCSNCFKSDAALGRHHPNGPVVQPCLSGGLWDAGVSITVGDRHIANWLIGQVRDETQTDEAMRIYAREIGADEQQFMEAFYNVPVMSLERFKKVAQALFTLANQLSTTAYQNIQQARVIADRQKAEENLLLLSTAINQTIEAVIITDAQGIIQYVNPAFETITGYLKNDIIGQNPRILKSGRQEDAFYRDLWNTISSGQTWTGRFINKRKNGSLYTEDATISPMRDSTGSITNYVAVKRDVTVELNKEEEYRQAQKMETVGQLAGGVAHDFNNILQAILGFSELLLSTLKPETSEYRNVAEIKKATSRATDITRQLLTFSRKQPVDKKQIDINSIIQDTDVLLQILLGDKIQRTFDLAQDLPPINADFGQMTQVIMNLAINARDAMPEGGRLTISTETVKLDPSDLSVIPESQPGEFVCLAMTDTGCGMNQGVKDHLFEPFFTTKEPGKGTGLGLAGIYGIIKKHNGWITVYSEENHGTTFKVYLPTSHIDESSAVRPDKQKETRREHILLVEDDLALSNLVISLLQDAGYQTSVAGSAEEALVLFNREQAKFDMLFSDIVLAGETGIELADRIRETHPALPILLYSGYRDQRERWSNLNSKGYHFLQKPFTVTSLLAAVYDTLNKTK
jgi:PAS domain S-box-containing protein